MQQDYGRAYRTLYLHHWWWRAREAWLLDALRRRSPASGALTILDVGCGDGLLFDRLAAFGTVEGVEPDARLLTPDGPHRARIHVQPFDASFQPGRRYDLILFLDVLEHLRDPAAALRHALALLAPAGRIVVTVPAFRALWTGHDVLNEHVTRYDRRSFAALAAQAGMRIDETRYFFHWTAPVKLVSALTERAVRRTPRPPRVPAAPVNRTLYAFSRLEQLVLGPLSLPFGSSLFVAGGRPAAETS